jgi:hypothetical protein
MSWQKRLQIITRPLWILGHIFFFIALVLWYLAEIGRLEINGLEAISAIVAAIVSYLGALLGWLSGSAQKPDQSQEWRNRKQLIQNVRAAWIHGVRDQSLHQSVWIELGLTYEPEQVKRPWHMTWQSSDNQQSLPQDTSILSIFRDKAANALLILGEPGSGKTVTLLDLAQQLLDEAEKKENRDAPIPVVLNLSTWALKRQPLQDWLLAELKTTYHVPEKTGRAWLESDALLLLLDGLDEVAEAHRQACVKAINTYRQEHGLTGTAVCCRREEYESLDEKLDLLGATVIQPLTAAQADNYLKRMGKELKAVRKFLKEVEPDDILHEWVESPLFLYVTAMAYRGLSLQQLRENHTGNLTQLYDAYVTQMLERHRPYEKTNYAPQQTRKWLAFLAKRLVERDLTVYYIEHMQADWLGERNGRRKDDSVSLRCLKSILSQEKIEIFDTHWSWPATAADLKSEWFAGLVGGFVSGFVGGFVGWRANVVLVGELVSVLAGVLVSGLVGGLVLVLAIRLIVGNISRSHKNLNQVAWDTLLNDLVTGLLIGLAGGFIGAMSGVLFGMLFVGSVSVLLIGLVNGDVRTHKEPNQGTWRTLSNGLFVGLISGFSGGLFVGMVGVMLIGILGALLAGTYSFIQHFALRRLLAHYDYLPWVLVPFLEFTKERLLLRRVGGGYIFIHRTIMEYFAAQDEVSTH